MTDLPTFPAKGEWPVRLGWHGIGLRPWSSRDQRTWYDIRRRNTDWLLPWDATTPPEGNGPTYGFGGMLSNFKRQARRGATLPWAMTYNEHWETRRRRKGVLAGQVTVSGITYGSARWAQIGYWIDRRWAGRGITPIAVALATEYCFRTLKLHRVEIAIRPENANSLRVVQKLGFRYEGMRPRYLHVAGAWRDHEVFALHSDELGDGLLVKLQNT